MSGGSVDRVARWGLFLLLFGIYLVGMSSERPWGEGEQLYEVAEAIVERGTVEVTWLSWPFTHEGPDGRVYAHYTILPSLVLLPAAGIAQLAGPRWAFFLVPIVTQIASAGLAALSGSLFYTLCRHLQLRPRVALVSALVLGLSTMVWVYSRRPQAEALEVACFLAFVLTIVHVCAQPSRGRALALGVVGGLLLNTDLVFWSAVVLGFAATIWELRARNPAGLRHLPWTAAAFLPFVALFLAYNHLRWGSPWLSGDEPIAALPAENLLWGVLGLVASPGRSILLFCPPLLLSVYAWPRFWRRHRRLALLLVIVTMPTMLVVASSQLWNGGLCWGPRVWLFAVPIALVPLAVWMDEWAGRPRGPARKLAFATVMVVALLGSAVQLVGNAFYWDHYIRFSQQMQSRWLGKPNRQGATITNDRRSDCEPCVEDMYAVVWVPAFSPIAGHAWMLQHIVVGSDAQAAAADAPWRRYTTLDIEVDRLITADRLDWWGTLWLVSYPERRATGLALLAVFSLFVVSGAGLSVRAWRSAAAGPAQADTKR